MALTPEEADRLAEVIARSVPPTTLADVVREQGLVPDFDTLRKNVGLDPETDRRLGKVSQRDRLRLPSSNPVC